MINKVLEQLLNKYNLEAEIDQYSRDVQKLVKALDYSLMTSNPLSTVHQADRINPQVLCKATEVFSKIKLINSVVTKKWASMQLNMETVHEYIPVETIVSARKYWKFNQYTMREDLDQHASTLVKTVHGIQETGLSRQGFARVAKCSFKLDQEFLGDYFEPIYENVVKSMTKARDAGRLKDKYFSDQANFETLVREVLDYYLVNDGKYNFEYNISDSRGRSIYNVVKRIANPISSKDIRALLVSAEPVLVTTVSKDKLNDIFYFIAELVGTKSKTEATKIAQGKRYYRIRKLPTLDLSVEADRKDLHELIWLERIYEKLDELYTNKLVQWDIPLEIDASMSLNQIVGALTGERRLLERTNVIGDTLTDPWAINGVRRLSGKLVGTPVFYGSSQTARALLKSKGQSVIPEEIKAINKEFSQGAFAVTKAFKNALINNYTAHTPTVEIKLWNDNFVVHVNKFKAVGTTVRSTIAYDTRSSKIRIARTRVPTLVPDYKHMKLYWATCMIHNLDSQIMDTIALQLADWMLTIHDAIICMPGTAGKARTLYAKLLKQLYLARKQVIKDYRNSIGATSKRADIDFMNLANMVQSIDDTCEFNASAMK